jgi:hypothetical protein
MLSSILEKLLVHSRTIQIMYLAKEIVRDCTLRCKVDEAKDLVDPIKETSLRLVKAYAEIKKAMEEGQTSEFTVPDVESLPPEKVAEIKASASRLISTCDRKLSEDK